MRSPVTRVLSVLFVLSLLLAACGGSDDGDSAEPEGEAATDETEEAASTDDDAEPEETDTPDETEETADAEATEDADEPAAGPADGEPIRFAAVVSQSGANAALGEIQQAAIEMAVADVNEAGGVLGGRPLEPIFEDAGSEAATGVAATQRALGQDPVAVLGHQYSFMVFPLVPVIEDAGIPFIHGAQTVELEPSLEGSEWYFRIRTSDALSADSLVALAVDELGAERPAIHHGTDPVSAGFREQVVEQLAAEGIEPVATESHDLGDSDMTAQIRSIIQADPDVVLVQTFVSESATIARQHQELGLDVPVLYGPAALFAVDFGLIELDLLEGDYMSLDSVPEYSEDPIELEWAERFRSEYDLPPTEIASSWYAAVLMLADGLERAGTTDPEPLRDALAETQLSEFNGVPVPGFELNCDDEHNCYNKRELVQIVDGTLRSVSTYHAQ